MIPKSPPGPVIDLAAAAGLIAPLTELVVRAGAAILAIDQSRMKTFGKDDGSPLTEADLAADHIIVDGLYRLLPDIPVISEERVGGTAPPDLTSTSFFLVDPLDGTKEFLAGHNDYTVNVALITDGRPLLGIIGAPALGLLWRGLVGRGAERLQLSPGGSAAASAPVAIRTRRQPKHSWIAAVSRSHADRRTEAFIEGRPGAVRRTIGSALKFCRVAEGAADIYPRLSAISEWDIAAGHAVVEAAGGKVTDSAGQPLRFGGRAGHYLVPEFIAWGDPERA